ncbi:hypothetical protein J3_0035 [Vibrio phage J3]|nr:hypothetical protein H1_0035 [Vibrio phage H1]AIZ01578.1 hypothetical protein H3_0035 [Vibrio phage H3]AIZ01674.1 hypothetical protein J3_0035 [Vibrio phage J3]
MTQPEKTVVRPDVDKYQKTRTAKGNTSLHSGDVVAVGLAPLVLSEVYAVAAEMMGVDVDTLVAKYQHLNEGMQRMNLGNRIRGAIAALDKGNAKEVERVTKANEKLLVMHMKEVDKLTAEFNAKIAKAEDPASIPPLKTPEKPQLAEVPELVTGKGEEIFNTVVDKFASAVNAREEAIKAEKERKAKEAAEKAAAKEAEAKAKAEVKAKAKADAEATDSSGADNNA